MPPSGPLTFRKMHGLGNDFVVIDQRSGRWPLTDVAVRRIGNRHMGVGFDQLAEILPGSEAAAYADLVFWNADGSMSAACGNATRCIAGMLMREADRSDLTVRTERGLLPCRRRPDGVVEVDMGPPVLDWRHIPLAREVDTVQLPLGGDPAACSMGNPHCTFFVPDAEAAPLTSRGPEVERDPLFPARTNVQFVEILSRTEARVRVWERGVGVTLASGSSSCAVIVNAVRRDLMDRQALLHLDGGDIEVVWRDDGHVLMAGPTASVFTGTFEREFLA
ncbi:MAG: diaminopimelate epimerase [Pseudomonadota bacterium]